MSFNPPSLFCMVLDFVAENVEKVDSLCGFPSAIGETLFERALTKRQFVCEDLKIRETSISKFCEAYENLVLVSLSLSNHLIVINEFLEPLLKISGWLTELDLSFNRLGDNHEFIDHICRLNSLKILSLRENSLSDNTVRKMTLPVQMFNKGLINLQEVDLSGNILTNAAVPWLARFPSLLFVDLTGTFLTEKGFLSLKTQIGMIPCNRSEWRQKQIVTQGWAAGVIDQWKDFCIKARAQKKVKTSNSFYSRNLEALTSIAPRSVCSKDRCFMKERSIESSVKRRSEAVSETGSQWAAKNTSKHFKSIEDEIFSEYM